MPSIQDLILSEMRKINEHASLGAGWNVWSWVSRWETACRTVTVFTHLESSDKFDQLVLQCGCLRLLEEALYTK